MKLVRLDEARPGQRLGRDVIDTRGSLLIKSGTTLTPDLMERLRGWKITHVSIDEAPTVTLDPSERPYFRALAIDKELDHVFSEAFGHPVMHRLRDAAAKYLKGRAK
ncbi:MAG: hypothetical protein HYY16_08520 [Planctomycetes bacterium]|nr:hypothetical protein [Planctomycetota bacterium]